MVFSTVPAMLILILINPRFLFSCLHNIHMFYFRYFSFFFCNLYVVVSELQLKDKQSESVHSQAFQNTVQQIYAQEALFKLVEVASLLHMLEK